MHWANFNCVDLCRDAAKHASMMALAALSVFATQQFRLWETQDSKKLKIVLNFQDCLVVSNFIPTFANEYET